MPDKKCAHCKKPKPEGEFHKNRYQKDGLAIQCKLCVKERTKTYHDSGKARIAQRSWYYKNHEHVRSYTKALYHKNIERRRACAHQSYLRRREKAIKQIKAWNEKNADWVRERNRLWKRNRYAADPKYRLSISFSALMRYSLRKSKNGIKWEKAVGYTVEELMSHLESKFSRDMSWINYGKYWEIDHMIPLASFNYFTIEDPDFIRAWTLSNLQPLPVSVNRSKGKRMESPFQPMLAIGA